MSEIRIVCRAHDGNGLTISTFHLHPVYPGPDGSPGRLDWQEDYLSETGELLGDDDLPAEGVPEPGQPWGRWRYAFRCPRCGDAVVARHETMTRVLGAVLTAGVSAITLPTLRSAIMRK